MELLQETGEIKGIKMNQEQGNYLMMYTCNVCQTRQNRSFTKQAYNHGVVLVRCEGCKNLHLIADNLGFFEDNPGK
jgi:protein import protein ZIM17